MPPRRRRQMSGAGLFSWIKKALPKLNKFIKKHKLISTVGSALGSAGVPYAGQGGNVAKAVGYGRRKRRVVRRRRRTTTGRGYKLAGQGYKLAGNGRRRRTTTVRRRR